MTVKELIDALSLYDDDATVLVDSYDSGEVDGVIHDAYANTVMLELS